MKRLTRLALALALAGAALTATACQPKVEVRTGTRVVCSFDGAVVSEDIKTVKVTGDEVGKYQVKTVTRLCDKHTKLEALYRQAQELIVKGDLKAAKEKLAQIVAVDAAYAKAKSQLDAIAANKKPAPDNLPPASGGSTPGTTTTNPPAKPGEGDTSNPSASLLKWAPDSIKGYKSTKALLDPLNITREYIPESSSPLSFVIVAEQDKTSTGAKAALKRQVQQAYPEDSDTLKVNGHDAYFGTDGRRYAILGFTDGSVMVALEMSVSPDDNPAKLKARLVDAAEQLP